MWRASAALRLRIASVSTISGRMALSPGVWPVRMRSTTATAKAPEASGAATTAGVAPRAERGNCLSQRLAHGEQAALGQVYVRERDGALGVGGVLAGGERE